MVFHFLTVEHKILTAAKHSSNCVVLDCLHRFFSELEKMKHFKGGNPSWGQQQMLSMASALISDPDFLLLNEPTEGIKPSITNELTQTLCVQSKERGFSIIISKKVVTFELNLVDSFLILTRSAVCSMKSVPISISIGCTDS